MAGRCALGFGGRQPSTHHHGEAALLGRPRELRVGAPWLARPLSSTFGFPLANPAPHDVRPDVSPWFRRAAHRLD
jgi:hypothetical protein